jgi:hypothetical protein
MTKEQFLKRINLIQNFHNEQDVLLELIDKLTDGNSIVDFGDNLVFEIIDMINEDMKINADDDLLSWWLYENVNKIIYEGKNCEIEIEVKTAEQLYDYIIENYNKPNK